jgi:hypothetical protein
MFQRTLTLLAFTSAFFLVSPLFAQYNPAAGENAPKMERSESYVDDSGEERTRTVHVDPEQDKYGNAAGNQFDLAVDGAFEGQTVAVLHFYTGEGFDFSLPKKALAQKGFSVYRWMNTAPSPEELEEKLEKACQLWIISDSQRHLNVEHLEVIREFYESGRGLYIWGDNQPYYSDANFVAENLLDTRMKGNLIGDQVVGVQARNTDEKEKSGIIEDHLLSTGLQNIYEGITIATIQPNQALTPLIWGSAGNLVAAFYDKDGKRAILDGGFTRLYIKWDSAGTPRYIKNAAAWLVNHERFGDEVVAADIKNDE